MLTETGYVRRTFDEILQDKIATAKELFGEDIDTSETSVLGKFLRINAYDQEMAEEEAEGIYYARFPNTATGTSLDRLCVFVGITRNPATASQYTVTVTGTAGTTVPQGFLVSTESDIEFSNTADTTIGTDGTCTITVECTETGTIGNISASDINTIVNPAANITSVVGTALVSSAVDVETDTALRQRFNEVKEGQGSCNENSIRAALLSVSGVTSASVIVNDTEETDSDGRPPHSFQCYVAGSNYEQSDIANAIFNKKPLGIKTYGDISVIVTDDGGNIHPIYFSEVTDVDVTVSVKIKINSDFNITSGTTDISNAIVAYINSLGVGTDVILTSLYGYIFSVDGVEDVTELLLGTQGSTATASNITISQWEVAQCQSVTVEVVTS